MAICAQSLLPSLQANHKHNMAYRPFIRLFLLHGAGSLNNHLLGNTREKKQGTQHLIQCPLLEGRSLVAAYVLHTSCEKKQLVYLLNRELAWGGLWHGTSRGMLRSHPQPTACLISSPPISLVSPKAMGAEADIRKPRPEAGAGGGAQELCKLPACSQASQCRGEAVTAGGRPCRAHLMRLMEARS